MLVGQKVGPFDVEKELGSGAMGTVYRAKYTKTGQQVAIKMVAAGLSGNETALARFEREGSILKQLKHPNIVRLYATGRFHGTPFYAMEFIEGESLDHVMARRGRLTWEEVIQIGRQLCAALQHAHEHGIIHRDLKPSNLMMLPDGTIKLTDFGIAKDMDVTQLTGANSTVGTAAYMSPEQCKGARDLTPKCDLYSMGVMLYELLTGRKPFHAETAMDMFLQHVQGTFERPSRLVLDIPIWLDTLVCHLLEKDPEKRPLNADMVARSLQGVLDRVETQQSAGLVAAKTRTVDRSSLGPDVDATDREAARMLAGKKKKKRQRPSYERWYDATWFKATKYGVFLAGLVLVVYFVFIKKPSADTLYDKSEELMAEYKKLSAAGPTMAEAKQIEELLDKARSGPIKDFLRYYPNDPRIGQVKKWADEADRWERERVMLLRMRNKVEITGNEEPIAYGAVHFENSGELAKAKKNWERLLRLRKDSGNLRSWGLVAEDHLRMLDDVETKEKTLKQELKELRQEKSLPAFSTEAQKLAAEALSLELDGDLNSAMDRWRELKTKFKNDELKQDRPERRWYLMAAMKIKDLESKVAKDDKPTESDPERLSPSDKKDAVDSKHGKPPQQTDKMDKSR